MVEEHVVETFIVEWPDRTRCPASLCLLSWQQSGFSLLLSEVVLTVWLCCCPTYYSATAQFAQQDCSKEDSTESMYVWSEWVHHSSLPQPPLCSLLAFNSGSQGKTEVIVNEWKIGNSKILQRRYTLINLSLPQDTVEMDSAHWIFKVSYLIYEYMNSAAARLKL